MTTVFGPKAAQEGEYLPKVTGADAYPSGEGVAERLIDYARKRRETPMLPSIFLVASDLRTAAEVSPKLFVTTAQRRSIDGAEIVRMAAASTPATVSSEVIGLIANTMTIGERTDHIAYLTRIAER